MKLAGNSEMFSRLHGLHICLLMLQKSLLRLNLFALCILGTGREEQLMVAKMYDVL